MKFVFLTSRDGQSLIEALVAMAIGALIVGSAVGSIVLTIRINAQNRSVQTANALSQELMDGARSSADSNWPTLYNLTKGSSTNYYFVPSSSGSLTIVTGKEGVLQNEIKNGLVGHWKLDEASGNTAYDSTGSDNGTLNGSPVRTSPCVVSDCLTFSGTGQYVNLPSSSSFPTTAITVSAWVYLTSHINWDDLVRNNWLSAPGTWLLFSDVSTNAYFGVADAALAQHNASGCGSAFTLNTWHHMVGTYDGSTVKVYLDGVQCATTSALSSQTLYTAGSIRIGDADGTSASHKIDDVRIYNRALSSTEVFQLYNSKPFLRYFSVENVNRDSSANIVTLGGTEDPSTQKITATANWVERGVTTNVQLVEFITRSKDEVSRFSNWNGGSGVEGPVTEPNTGYSSQTNIDSTTTPGSIQVVIP